MKAIIPVAGIGSRLRPHTHTQPKALITVAGKPILAHIMNPLIEAGVKDFVFIIGYLGDKIEQYISTHYPDLNCQFVIQTTGKGIGHAIWLARDSFSDQEEIMIILGDTIIETNFQQWIDAPNSMLGIKKVQDPRRFGVAEVDEQHKIIRLVEKPALPKSNLALVGLYKIKESGLLKQSLQHIIDKNIKTQNEYHLTDALMDMIEKGAYFEPLEVNHWFDCGKKEVLLETNATLLQRNKQQDLPQYPNTIVVPPVYIDPSARISNSIIGPDVSIGENAILDYSIIKDSIIGPYAQLEFAILDHSLIGNDSVYKGPLQSLNLGDSTEIHFSH